MAGGGASAASSSVGRARGDVDPALLVLGRQPAQRRREIARARCRPSTAPRRRPASSRRAGAGPPATSPAPRATAAPSPRSRAPPGRNGCGIRDDSRAADRPGPCRRARRRGGSEAGGARSDRPTAPSPNSSSPVARSSARAARSLTRGTTSAPASNRPAANRPVRSSNRQRGNRRALSQPATPPTAPPAPYADSATQSTTLAASAPPARATGRAAGARTPARRPPRARNSAAPRPVQSVAPAAARPGQRLHAFDVLRRQLQLLRALEQAARRFGLAAHHRQRPLVDDGLGAVRLEPRQRRRAGLQHPRVAQRDADLAAQVAGERLDVRLLVQVLEHVLQLLRASGATACPAAAASRERSGV